MHSTDAHFTGVPDITNSPGSQEPRISKKESTALVSDLTSDKFCRFRPIVQNSVLPRYGSPAINLENQDLHTFRDFFFSSKFPGHKHPCAKWTTKHTHDNCYRALTGGRTAPRVQRKKTAKTKNIEIVYIKQNTY